jgi:DNA (cytosine-5)-methyltransferase 1
MSQNSKQIPVIDLFSGPGGLGEGFSAYQGVRGPRFQIKLSIEKDPAAHKTLRLRSFFRQFPQGKAPEEYYDYISGYNGVTLEKLEELYPVQWKLANEESWLAELGSKRFPEGQVDSKIAAALGGAKEWILIGGPPCQAYSLVGRARMKGADEQIPLPLKKTHGIFCISNI